MSDLSRSLVDAAAEAMRLERVRCLRETGCSASPEQEAAAGVAAVLETLSASLAESARHHDALGSIDDGLTFRGLVSGC